MHLFYTPDITTQTSQFFLSEEESKHCVRVLRLQEGDEVQLVDGKGGMYVAKIVDANPKKVLLQIVFCEQGFGKRDYFLHVAIAPTKNIERVEWFVEKATEVGVDCITPIICERSERKELRVDRLEKIITSAMKQSLKAYHPVLEAPIKIKDFLKKDFDGAKMIAHCMPDEKGFIADFASKAKACLVMIGPEGDFSPTELEIAKEKGFKTISLGEARLRTETAALQSCVEVALLNR